MAGGALFYVRAYGRWILPGFVTDHRNGTYDITILPLDAGLYQLEVVLTFSHPPPWNASFTCHRYYYYLGYEGYLLPGFPLPIAFRSKEEEDNNDMPRRQVRRSASTSTTTRRLCGQSDWVEQTPRSTVERGRWLVLRKSVENDYYHQQNESSASFLGSSTFNGYLSGVNSLGVRLDYVPTFCSLWSNRQAHREFRRRLHKQQQRAAREGANTKGGIRVLFIGDSNFRIQQQLFNQLFGDLIESELISTSGGILHTLPMIKARLRQLRDVQTAEEKEEYFILFNTGLHDIDKLCARSSSEQSSSLTTTTNVTSFFSTYRTAVEEFVDVVNEFPATLRVWQTTSAGWPKWGLYGVAWPPHKLQPFPLSPNFVEHLNAVAWEIMNERQILVMDSYWLTLARPDHRQITMENTLSQHLVHAGEEVYSVLLRKWLAIILDAL